MTKAKEYALLLQPVATSEQLNNAIADYIQMGLMIGQTNNYWSDTLSGSPSTNTYHFWFPFDGTLCVFDRLRFHGLSIAWGTVATPQYSVDSGASWNAMPAGTASGVPMSTLVSTTASSLYYDIDISAAAGQYLGLRTVLTAAGACTDFAWNWLAYLWHSTLTPF